MQPDILSTTLSPSLSPIHPPLQLTVPIPTTSNFTDLEPLDDIAEQIFAAGTLFIYSYTFYPSDAYLYQEAIRLHFAPIDGYIWGGNSNALDTFPMSNPDGCGTSVRCMFTGL